MSAAIVRCRTELLHGHSRASSAGIDNFSAKFMSKAEKEERLQKRKEDFVKPGRLWLLTNPSKKSRPF